MSKLEWRTAITLELAERLIPDPRATHNKLASFSNVEVAVEGGFLHVVPAPGNRGGERDVYIVPASMVRSVAYREAPRSGNMHAS
ncbi:hypothetical protein ACFVWY_05760 [Streptomyces sp. NPDC058195]|uniref:hypothetical protein n=1 Tax=Streptomyces sp. NPDC058195 TaxID=3346375 RepID=UPI0036E15137